MGIWKRLNLKFSVKSSDKVFYVTVADADIGRLKYHL